MIVCTLHMTCFHCKEATAPLADWEPPTRSMAHLVSPATETVYVVRQQFSKYDVWNEYSITFEIKNYDSFFVVTIVSLWFLRHAEVVRVIRCYEIGSEL